ncbi:MAG: DEAD/DEAH box helicase, partial [Opitutaceae bacterium]|nr:DEAD/DEAH box helicase [Opitutaceae bacterium]
MLRKLIAKIRAKVAPSTPPPAKPAKKPAGPPAPRPTRPDATGKDGKRSRPREERSGRQPREPREPRGKSREGGGRNRRGERPPPPRPSRPSRPPRDDTFEYPRRDPVKPRTPVEIPPQDTAFSKLGLNDPIAYAAAEMGYTDPTPIQTQAVPHVLEGRDLTGSAQTGTGKTAAFALPVLHRLGAHGRLRCLVLEPTRELALQVEEAFQKYSRYTDLTTTIVYGG